MAEEWIGRVADRLGTLTDDEHVEVLAAAIDSGLADAVCAEAITVDGYEAAKAAIRARLMLIGERPWVPGMDPLSPGARRG